MTRDGTSFVSSKRKPSAWLILAIVLLHLAIFYGLLRAFAPGAVQTVERTVVSAFSVTVTTPDETPPENEPVPDEGAQGDPGRDAVPKPVSAPTPRQPVQTPQPAPQAASTGNATSSGARDSGQGTGAAGSGLGTGSGREGSGRGGVATTKPVKISGDINSAADFPIPEGGRQARFGNSVTVAMTVGINGRASNCRVVRPSPDPQADAIVCRLAVERFRFRPATDANGDPVPATYGWRQDWFAR